MSNESAIVPFTNNDIVRSVDDLTKMASILVKSKMIPNSVATPEAAVAIILKGRELGIGAMEALSGINVILGKPTVSPQLMLALARRTKELEDFRILDDGETCTVFVTRKNQSTITTTFSMKDAEGLGLINKDNWKKQPKTMRQWRCVAANLRVSFPDAISGLYTPDELGAEVETDDEGHMTITKMPEPTTGTKTITAPIVDGKLAETVERTEPLPETETVKGTPVPYDALVHIKQSVEGYPAKRVVYFKKNPDGMPTDKQILAMSGLAASWLETLVMQPQELTASNRDFAGEMRRVFLRAVFGREHINELSVDELGGILDWLGLENKVIDGKKTYIPTDKTKQAKKDIDATLADMAEKMGQTKMEAKSG